MLAPLTSSVVTDLIARAGAIVPGDLCDNRNGKVAPVLDSPPLPPEESDLPIRIEAYVVKCRC
jgi:hypothetical protein